MPDASVTILPWSPDKAPLFDAINREWIADMFTVEAFDDAVLKDPQHYILDKGGDILFAALPSGEIVGTGALMRKGDGAFELTKMGVSANARGHKVGEALLQALIERAEALNIETLFLLTSTKCEAAIHLYEKNGFTHDKDIMERYGKSYARCNVAMKYNGTP